MAAARARQGGEVRLKAEVGGEDALVEAVLLDVADRAKRLVVEHHPGDAEPVLGGDGQRGQRHLEGAVADEADGRAGRDARPAAGSALAAKPMP